MPLGVSEANPLAPCACGRASFGPVLWAKKGSKITKKHDAVFNLGF